MSQLNQSKTIAATNETICSVMGLNNFNQLLPNNGNLITVPTQIKTNFPIFKVYMGDFHSLVIDESLHIHSIGSNIYGQLGTSNSKNNEYNSILNNKNIESVACGYCHSLALSTEGDLYSWGLNLKGQLGNGTIMNSLEPFQINVVSINNNETTINSKKEIDSSSLSRNSCISKRSTNQNIKHFNNISQRSLSTERKSFNQSIDLRIQDCEKEILYLMPKEKVAEIACGSLHSLIRTTSRRIFSSGFNDCFALGNNDRNPSSIFKPILFFIQNNIQVSKIACGTNMSACISLEGNLYEWGLVSGTKPSEYLIYKEPTLISLNSRNTSSSSLKKKSSNLHATDIKLGDAFSLILTENVKLNRRKYTLLDLIILVNWDLVIVLQEMIQH